MLTSASADHKPKVSTKIDRLAQLGTITATLIRCQKGDKSFAKCSPEFGATAKESIPEKALKGRSISQQAEWVDIITLLVWKLSQHLTHHLGLETRN